MLCTQETLIIKQLLSLGTGMVAQSLVEDDEEKERCMLTAALLLAFMYHIRKIRPLYSSLCWELRNQNPRT